MIDIFKFCHTIPVLTSWCSQKVMNFTLNFLKKLNLLEWHWLIRFYRSQGNMCMIHDLYIALHAHTLHFLMEHGWGSSAGGLQIYRQMPVVTLFETCSNPSPHPWQGCKSSHPSPLLNSSSSGNSHHMQSHGSGSLKEPLRPCSPAFRVLGGLSNSHSC